MTRNKKDKNRPHIPAPSTDSIAKREENDNKDNIKFLEGYGLSVMQSFMKADEDIIAIAYKVNTGHVGREEIVNKYKNTMITALQRKAREKGYMVSVEKIIFNCLPLGEDTLIKAFATLKDVKKARSGESVLEKPSNDPFKWDVNNK